MCALAVAVVGAVKDVRGARIPNWLTYSGLGSALAVRGVMLGWVGLKGGLTGLLLAGGIFYFLFLLGGMGGGDVKLMAAVGAWAGVRQVETILIGSAIAGGIIAVWYVLAYRQLGQALLNTLALAQHHLTSGLRPHPYLNVRAARYGANPLRIGGCGWNVSLCWPCFLAEVIYGPATRINGFVNGFSIGRRRYLYFRSAGAVKQR